MAFTDSSQKPHWQNSRTPKRLQLLLLILIISIIVYGGVFYLNLKKSNIPNFPDTGTVVTPPELPRVILNSAYPALSPARTVRSVKNTCGAVADCTTSLQTAIDNASLGDEIVVDAGMVINGPITLKNKITGSGWIVIRTSNLTNLPPEGSRVRPADAVNMAKILAPGSNSPAVFAAPSSHHYRLVGLEFTKINPAAFTGELLSLGINDSTQTTLAQVPHDIILDRVYVHGDPTSNLKRGISLNSATSSVIDSYVSDIHVEGQDSQALAGFNGPGPYKIVNNYFEASTENVLFGGSDPQVPNLVPSDIVFKNNYLYKPRSWRVEDPTYGGKHWSVKNLFELKNSQRVLIEGNIFDGNWVDGQVGRAILFNPRNSDGGCPWCIVQDITFQNNIIRHVSAGLNITGHDDNNSSQLTQRLKIYNNLWDDVSAANWGGDGKWLLVLSGINSPGPSDMQIVHNTIFNSGAGTAAFIYPGEFYNPTYSPKPNTIISDNIAPHNDYGVLGSSDSVGNKSISDYFPGGVFTKNILMGGPASLYTQYPGNYFPPDWSTVFVNQPAGDYHVLPDSIYHNAGTDGKDLGADIDAINTATATTLSGAGIPITTESVSPTVAITAPSNGSNVSGLSVLVSAAASDNAAISSVQFMFDGAALGPAVTSAPFEITWNSTTAADGPHTFTAVATDTSNNTATSPSVSVTVINTAAYASPYATPTIGGGGGAPAPAPVPSPVPVPVTSLPVALEPDFTSNPLFPDGSLVLDRGVIYVMDSGLKRPFVSMPVFLSYGLKLSNVKKVDTSTVPSGAPILTKGQKHARGSLINDNGTIYFLGADQRYGFPSSTVFFSWGNQFKDVVNANSSDHAVPEGPIVQTKP